MMIFRHSGALSLGVPGYQTGQWRLGNLARRTGHGWGASCSEGGVWGS